MSSKTYRYYCLDSTGRLHNADWFQADSDEEAIARVEAKHPDGKCEVWEEHRMVAALEPARGSDILAGSLRTLDEARRILRDTASLVSQPLSRDPQPDPR